MNRITGTRGLAGCTLAVALALVAGVAAAHESEAGTPGKAADAARTVEVTMFDSYYEPDRLSVSAGETVRFVVRNEGELVHEFNIGTAAMHAAHRDEMMAMMESGMLEADRINMHAGMAGMDHGMSHDDPNAVLLEPGQTGEVVWTFADKAELEFACNVPGHYEAGMHGPISFTN